MQRRYNSVARIESVSLPADMRSLSHEVTRFAPSPTGMLHLGHVYAAQVAEGVAHRTDGRFLLRIDDIDAGRSRPEFETMIYEDLRWLGFDWQPPLRRQSDCAAEYGAALERLRASGVIYPCFCTRKEILQEAAVAQDAPHGAGGPVYPGTCRTLSPEEYRERVARGLPAALRLNVTNALARIGYRPAFDEHGAGPDGESGTIRIQPEISGDVVVAREDGDAIASSYHLAVVVDDAAQEISLVTRGNDLFHATHVQRLLQVLLGLPAPQYMHHALVADDAGKRLAKRHDALSVRHLRESGLSAAAVRAMALKGAR